MNQTSITFVALGGALLLWATGVSLTSYLGDEQIRHWKGSGHAHSETSGGKEDHQVLIDGEIKKISEELEKKPGDQDLQLQLANLMFEAGMRFGKAEYLKGAVGHFHEVVTKNPKQKEALLGLATLSLHVGVGEKAAEYYQKYLDLVPEDDSARSNLALAISRSGNPQKALELINKILKKDDKFVIALVTKGLILKELGKKEDAKQEFDKAQKIETNPVLLERIAQLKAELDVSRKDMVADDKSQSPKDFFESYFKTHPVFSSKFVKLKIDGNQVLVNLRDFPVDKMPEMAKAKLNGSLSELLKAKGLKSIKLISEESGVELIKVELP